jgi:hypothetical protein
MVPFIYRCPATGLNVQGLLADDLSANKSETYETYETVKCAACSRMHLIHRSTGKILGREDK